MSTISLRLAESLHKRGSRKKFDEALPHVQEVKPPEDDSK